MIGNRIIGVLILSAAVTLSVESQEYIGFNDFEIEIGTWSGWAIAADYTVAGEPVHGGDYAAKVEGLQESGWTDARVVFPEGIDATGTDQFRVWVYSDQIFELRVDLGVEVVLGFRDYGPSDVGKWKEMVFWYTEEQGKLWADLLANVNSLRMWINPDASTIEGVDVPATFEGTIYFDDMRLRKRVPVEREYLPLIGFNSAADEGLVTLESGGAGAEINLSGNPTPTEGTGFLQFVWTAGWNENITINLRDFPQFRSYDRIHFDLFIDGPSDWGGCSQVLKVAWTDANGNARGTGWTTLEETITGGAVGDWREFSGQYGPLNDAGYTRDWLLPEVAGVYDDPNGTITLTLTSQGGDSLDSVPAYLDNIRLSRPKGSSVADWELW